ncbi:MAG: cyanobactin biosynthesis system PatB/AcyB/McaB family protein [Moorea sp. SIOASIH]|uniref:cyanobactin biosynthesis system PatB/AcyB/McaB family protein n=1 Tax=Moorena sp. SIOASIH TaxID=2607817 RepID=UPI0013B6C350|nr:cyanobactin biosynthesis system PatB/AcyB/McaB family protein [Moorena sp. SIOASIH]NEO37853.1 cyanobactin biosynthesis system PatB/AcyB/McaB family protein [Moorena sp. SIOASIH]NEO90272.1 cyanobactin biosynthesis system PatB/AcyB/McaB family protein [Moorena sp. SIO3G5]
MRYPKQVAPVKRPDLIQPYQAVDVVHGRGQDLVTIRMDLTHGANYNDPAPFAYPSYQQLKTSGWGGWY